MANSEQSLLRAIDIPAVDGYAGIQQWFFTPEEMSQFLCALKASVYVHRDGTIKDQDGEIVGLWFHAEFSNKHPVNTLG